MTCGEERVAKEKRRSRGEKSEWRSVSVISAVIPSSTSNKTVNRRTIKGAARAATFFSKEAAKNLSIARTKW